MNSSLTKLKIQDVSIHARSKRELYRMLQLEGDVHLPLLSQANHCYVSGIFSGKIKVLFELSLIKFVKASRLKVLQVPQIKGLKTIDIVNYARTQFNIDEYLPKFKNQEKLPDRSWVWNIGTISYSFTF